MGLLSRDIAAKYDRFAPWYDWLESIPNLLGLSRLRRGLLRDTSGKVLEVAVGTGKNLAFYPCGCRIIALDLSREMLKVARNRATKLTMHASFLVANAEALPFRDNAFDTIVSTLSTCTFPNPVTALEEMALVCRPEGRVLLLEHGRSDRERLGRWQDRHADQFAKPLGCHWNREPLDIIRKAGLKIKSARRVFFGIFHEVEAAPGSSSTDSVNIGLEFRMNRRDFLTRGLLAAGTIALAGCTKFEAAEHRYQLAPESILPADIAKAPAGVRKAYRFAILNRDTLRYIPCYCGCGSEGHTSNASCYFKDSSTPAHPVFDRMSLA